MQTVDCSRVKKLAVKRVIREDVPACRRCGNKTFLWDMIQMVKTCKNDKCKDESGVM